MKKCLGLLICLTIVSSVYSDPMIKTSKDSYESFEPIVVTFSGLVGESREWANVIEAHKQESEYGTWQYTHESTGTLTFDGQKAGQYEARLFNGDSKVVARYKFTVVESQSPLFDVTTNTEVPQYAQVFKGDGQDYTLEVTIVQIGDPKDNTYIVKYGGTINHPWNGKTFLYRKNEVYAYGRVNEVVYWTVIKGERHNTIQGRQDQWGGGMKYIAYIKGNYDGTNIYYSEKLSKAINPKDIVDEYLKTTGQSQTKSTELKEDDKLKRKIEELETMLAQEKENSRIKEEKLQSKIEQLEAILKKQKEEADKEIEALKNHNNQLAKDLDIAQKGVAGPNVESYNPAHASKVTIEKRVLFESEYLRMRDPGQYDTYRVLYVKFKAMVNNRSEVKQSVVGIDVDFWVGEKWVKGTMAETDFTLPQYLPENSPSNIEAAAWIKAGDDVFSFPLNIKVTLKLFTGEIVEKELILRK